MHALNLAGLDSEVAWKGEFQRAKQNYEQQAGRDELDRCDTVWDSIASSVDSGRGIFDEASGQGYEYHSGNAYEDVDSPFELARQLHAEGRLTEATLACEAAIRRDEARWEYWKLLGECHSENEMESKAMHAYRRCLQLNAECLEALMSLSVCLTNEGQEHEATSLLNTWICKKYSHPLKQDASRDDLTRLFLGTIRENQLAKEDTDLQLGLGLLKYNQYEYDKAIDCFEMAVKRETENSVLWNTLGATLANSGKSEQAIARYHRALALRPGFVRARHNLAIGCMNIGCYTHAIDHLIKCLEGQAIGQTNIEYTSDAVWETLRRCLVILDKNDDAARCSQRDLRHFLYEYARQGQ